MTGTSITSCSALPVATAGGVARFVFQIPMDTSLAGLHFYNQGLVMDPGVNFLGATVTNAAEGIVGIK